MAAGRKDQKTPSRTSRKSTGQSPTRSRSTSKTSAATKRAQPKAMGSSRTATKSMKLPAKARSTARATTASAARKSSAAAGRGTVSRRSRSAGGQNWLTSIETMITTREGREIIAEALRAVATVLDSHNQRDQSGASAARFGEAQDQGLHTSDPITNPATEAVTGAIGMAQATTEMVTDAATGVMLGGIDASDRERDGNESNRREARKGRSSRKRTSSGHE